MDGQEYEGDAGKRMASKLTESLSFYKLVMLNGPGYWPSLELLTEEKTGEEAGTFGATALSMMGF